MRRLRLLSAVWIAIALVSLSPLDVIPSAAAQSAIAPVDIVLRLTDLPSGFTILDGSEYGDMGDGAGLYAQAFFRRQGGAGRGTSTVFISQYIAQYNPPVSASWMLDDQRNTRLQSGEATRLRGAPNDSAQMSLVSDDGTVFRYGVAVDDFLIITTVASDTGAATFADAVRLADVALKRYEKLAASRLRLPAELFNNQGHRLDVFVQYVATELDGFWSGMFRNLGSEYVAPKIAWTGPGHPVRSACGASGQTIGPAYCRNDLTVYLDVHTQSDIGFAALWRHPDPDAPFVIAMIMAHEWGHHVQALTERYIPGRWEGLTKRQLELSADCLAGMFARHIQITGLIDYRNLNSVVPLMESVSDEGRIDQHGTTIQRIAAFSRGVDGYNGQDLSACRTW